MFTKVERLVSLRNLRPKKKEGFLKVISIFSFLGITLGVAILIIVMSVMNGFRIDLTDKILGFNPHITIKPYVSDIDKNYKDKLKKKYKDLKIISVLSGEGIVVVEGLTQGVLIKGIDRNDKENHDFVKNKLSKGNFKNFKDRTIIIGKELALDLDLGVNKKINLMSSAFINTPLGGFPKQETFKIIGVFDSGFYEFDRNVVFLNLNDTISLFDKTLNDVGYEVYLDEPIKANFYKEEIQKINEDYFVYSWTDLNKSLFAALKVERNVMFIILTLIIIVAAFNIISGLTILIKNKTKEIAILKTLGLSNNSITKSFFLTGFTIGILASITGVIIGVLFATYIEQIRNFISNTFSLEIFPPDIYFLDKMPSEVNLISVSIIFIFSIIITALASYFPARMVSKMDTIKALKYE